MNLLEAYSRRVEELACHDASCAPPPVGTGGSSTVGKIRSVLTDDLRRAPWKGCENPMAGHCYTASEALYHAMGGKAAGLTPMQINHEGAPHWFLKTKDGGIIDPTADQFKTPVPYEKAKGKGFLTRQPSKRARTILERAGLLPPIVSALARYEEELACHDKSCAPPPIGTGGSKPGTGGGLPKGADPSIRRADVLDFYKGEAGREFGWDEEQYGHAVKAATAYGEYLKEQITAGNLGPRIRIPYELAEQILIEDQRIRTQHETGASWSAAFDPDHRYGIEELMYGVPETDPIYGYMGTTGKDNGYINGYGPVSVVLKDTVLDRTALVFDDSLRDETPAPVTVSEIMSLSGDALGEALIAAVSPAYSGPYNVINAFEVSLRNPGKEPWIYTEAHIHGPVTKDDIKEIIVNNRYNNDEPETHQALRDAGYTVVEYEGERMSDTNFGLLAALGRREEELACNDRSCAPPPVGKGGSTPGYGSASLPDVRLGGVRVTYSPDYPDGGPDPGEIVWAKVPFEDDPTQMKDRPVLVIGRVEGSTKLAAVQLTSKMGKRDTLAIGSGDWDRSGRQSAVKLDRVIQVGAVNYRREGAVMPRRQFEHVIGHLAAHHRTPIEEFACHDKSCAPPPVGTGGSKPETGGSKSGKRWTGLSPSPQSREGAPSPRITSFVRGSENREDLADLGFGSNEELAEAIYANDLGTDEHGRSFSSRVTQVRVQDNGLGGSMLQIDGDIMIDDGKHTYGVGVFKRYIHAMKDGNGKTQLVADHDYLKVDEDFHGLGVADAFNSHAVEMYQFLGVDRISVHASLRVGPYAWARQGFRIDPEIQVDWVDRRVGAVRKLMDDGVKEGRWSKEEADEIKKTATAMNNAVKKGEDVQPIHVASLGEGKITWDEDGVKMWPGKRVLINHTYGDGARSYDPYGQQSGWYGNYYFDRKNPVTVASSVDLEHVAYRGTFGASASLTEALQRRLGFIQMLEENEDTIAA